MNNSERFQPSQDSREQDPELAREMAQIEGEQRAVAKEKMEFEIKQGESVAEYRKRQIEDEKRWEEESKDLTLKPLTDKQHLWLLEGTIKGHEVHIILDASFIKLDKDEKPIMENVGAEYAVIDGGVYNLGVKTPYTVDALNEQHEAVRSGMYEFIKRYANPVLRRTINADDVQRRNGLRAQSLRPDYIKYPLKDILSDKQ